MLHNDTPDWCALYGIACKYWPGLGEAQVLKGLMQPLTSATCGAAGAKLGRSRSARLLRGGSTHV